MKNTLLALAILAGLTTTTASAQAGASMQGMPMKGAVKVGRGSGIVTAIDPKAAKVTIQHGPIAALGWPAMTMAFTAIPPALLKTVKVGQRVDFAMRMRGSVAEVTAIRAR
ncbi:copper-binding protein [Sphingomonas sp. BK481]|uniref:copper-binding protein n=1 Tax=Sphingomonas sp. BK481 TaxID=2586981 RepID=UPI001610BE6E|nr:copper-binding protein [Sphingomonas sp. BK481]MBB3588487.1 Cu(I)/Ag(I) efflux system protein CusF [Sphingomonas sp. BK481]